MTEYVARDDVKKIALDILHRVHLKSPLSISRFLYDFGRSIGSVQTTKIVRCRECEHWNDLELKRITRRGECYKSGHITDENFFCGCGEEFSGRTR